MSKNLNINQIFEVYKVTVKDRRLQRKCIPQSPFSYTAINPPMYFQEEVVPTLTIEIEEENFRVMADKIAEFDNLMRDPETAKLLMEARFINRLKGNR